jgi:hypothetical protein
MRTVIAIITGAGLFAVLDWSSHSYASAGHPPPSWDGVYLIITTFSVLVAAVMGTIRVSRGRRR